MTEAPQTFRFDRQDQLPLEFQGWLQIEVATQENSGMPRFILALYRTVGDNWVSVHTCRQPGAGGRSEHTTSVHAARDEAVEMMGYGRLARMVRRQLGYPEVERIP